MLKNLPFFVRRVVLKKIFLPYKDQLFYKLLTQSFVQIEQVETFTCYNPQDYQTVYICCNGEKGILESSKDIIVRRLQEFYPLYKIKDIDIFYPYKIYS